jgi:undecaprenyl diphosphate synthase
MEFALRVIANHGADYARRGIRIRYLGRQDRRVPAPVREAMLDIQARTADNSGLNLTFAFNYGGRAEIVDACRRLIDEGTAAEEVDEAIFRESMQFPELPDPDLIIRTGGEYRISNFLLWGAAYAELIFLDVLWPDFRDSDFAEALRWYATRARRFGAVPPAQDHA